MVCNNQDIEVDRGRTKGQENGSKRKKRRNFSFIRTIYVVYDKMIQHSVLNTQTHKNPFSSKKRECICVHTQCVCGMSYCEQEEINGTSKMKNTEKERERHRVPVLCNRVIPVPFKGFAVYIHYSS